METNLHLDKKTEISSPIKDAISSHIEKFYAPKVQGNAGSTVVVNDTREVIIVEVDADGKASL